MQINFFETSFNYAHLFPIFLNYAKLSSSDFGFHVTNENINTLSINKNVV